MHAPIEIREIRYNKEKKRQLPDKTEKSVIETKKSDSTKAPSPGLRALSPF